MIEPTERRIVCAAIRTAGGFIICSARHFDNLMHMQIAKSVATWERGIEQGFIDQRGEFLNRSDAWVVACEAKQIIRRVGGDHKGVLFSENLY